MNSRHSLPTGRYQYEENDSDSSFHTRDRPSTSSSGVRWQMAETERGVAPGLTQNLRLPQIQLPPPNLGFNRHPTHTIGTCPSLHQHPPGASGRQSTQSSLREFFARADDTASRSTAWTAVASHGVNDGFKEPIHAGARSHHAAPCVEGHYSRDREFDSTGARYEYQYQSRRFRERMTSRENLLQQTSPMVNQSSFSSGEATLPSRSAASSSSGVTREQQGHDPQSQISNDSASRPSLLESTLTHIEELDSGDLYRCGDCNRKCKSKASYLKHKSMMCTHRLGPLTLECRYCKRQYTYAGYLQRHEHECAKLNPSS